jgi:signal transduction histidine kinase
MAMLLSFWLFIFIGWFQARDTISAIFVVRQFAFLVYAAGFIGYPRYLGHGYLSAQTVDYAYSWLAILICSLSFLFESRFLKEYDLPKWAKLAMWVVAVMVFIAPILLLADQTMLALRINMMVTGVICFTLFAVSMAIRPSAIMQDSPQATDSRYLLPKTVVCMYYGILLLILVYYILPALGLSKASVWTAYGALFYSVSAGLMMTVLLIYRAKKIEDLRVAVSTQLLKSEAELLAETRRRHDQSRLLSMLMHEIKTPLAVIDMAMARLGREQKTSGYVERAIDNMKTILDRCVQTDRMLDAGFQINKQPVQVSDQLRVWAQDRKEGAHRFQLDLEPALQLDTDLQCLQIIVNNLFENAFKHGHAEAALTSQPSADGRPGILLEFSNLPGSSEWPDEAQVFSKYYRSAKAQRQSGTGLGLYLSRNLAEQLGGSLRYRTAEGRIIFDLWLPS